MAKTSGGAGKEPTPNKKKSQREAQVTDAGRTVYDVSPEQFVYAWQTSRSADEVAEKLKMPKPIVHARASSYREKGVPLKKMPRHTNRGLDLKGLNAIIERLNKEQGVSQATEPKVTKGQENTTIDPDAVQAVVEQVMAKMRKKMT